MTGSILCKTLARRTGQVRKIGRQPSHATWTLFCPSGRMDDLAGWSSRGCADDAQRGPESDDIASGLSCRRLLR